MLAYSVILSEYIYIEYASPFSAYNLYVVKAAVYCVFGFYIR